MRKSILMALAALLTGACAPTVGDPSDALEERDGPVGFAELPSSYPGDCSAELDGTEAPGVYCVGISHIYPRIWPGVNVSIGAVGAIGEALYTVEGEHVALSGAYSVFEGDHTGYTVLYFQAEYGATSHRWNPSVDDFNQRVMMWAPDGEYMGCTSWGPDLNAFPGCRFISG